MASDARVLVFDAAGSPSLAVRVRRALGAAAVAEDPTGGATSLAAAVGVIPAGSIERARSFAGTVRGVPAFLVTTDVGGAWLGPLMLPARAGCWNCARERIVAAAAAESRPAFSAPSGLSSRAAALVVRELRTILRCGPHESMLLDHVLECPIEGDAVLHRVIPLAECAFCGGAAAHPRNEAIDVSAGMDAEELLMALAGWVDNRMGVISRVVLNATEPVFVATAAPPHLLDSGDSPRRFPVGWGKGHTVSSAILSAVGEAIERYSASVPDSSKLVWTRTAELEGDVLDPRTLPLYSEEQYARDGFPFVRFDGDAVHPWVRGWWAGTHEPVWVPAILAYLSMDLRRENLFCQGTSNGLACSTTLEDAARRATLELIERDAFLAAWMTGAAGIAVDSPQIARAVSGASVETYLLPTAVRGAAAVCLALGDGESYPGVTIALGCDADPQHAISQAALELAQTGPHLCRMMRAGALRVPACDEDVREMLNHAAYFFDPARAGAFDKLRGSGARMQTQTGDDIRVAIVDVTSADVATGPFRVVRAISPDLQPISYGYGLERRVVKRIRDLGVLPEVPKIHPIW